MRNKRKAHLTEYKAIIEEAIHRLPNGESRLSISGSPLNYACLKEFYAPDLSERLSSDHSMDSGNNEIENQYAEEVSAIEQLLIENDVQISLSGWQSRAKAAEKIFKGMNRKAYAIQMWEWYAIPWRFKGGKIHLIWPPHDLMGTPIIHSYSVDDFLKNLVRKEETQFEELLKSEKHRKRWEIVGTIAGIALLIALFALFQ